PRWQVCSSFTTKLSRPHRLSCNCYQRLQLQCQ
ncbi:MAG: hypothetical protein JWR15_2036, partial [Prosthecobacter sp.]|nr:hypothetical protein [Prosthecobacter sp.]